MKIKWYWLIAVTNTLLVLIISISLWGGVVACASYMRLYFEKAGIDLPLPTAGLMALIQFFKDFNTFPLVICILLFFGNLLFIEFLIRKKTDKIEFLLLHLEVIIVQFLLYLMITLFSVVALIIPLTETGCKVMSRNPGWFHTINIISMVLMVVVIMLVFVITRLLYKKH